MTKSLQSASAVLASSSFMAMLVFFTWATGSSPNSSNDDDIVLPRARKELMVAPWADDPGSLWPLNLTELFAKWRRWRRKRAVSNPERLGLRSKAKCMMLSYWHTEASMHSTTVERIRTAQKNLNKTKKRWSCILSYRCSLDILMSHFTWWYL